MCKCNNNFNLPKSSAICGFVGATILTICVVAAIVINIVNLGVSSIVLPRTIIEIGLALTCVSLDIGLGFIMFEREPKCPIGGHRTEFDRPFKKPYHKPFNKKPLKVKLVRGKAQD